MKTTSGPARISRRDFCKTSTLMATGGMFLGSLSAGGLTETLAARSTGTSEHNFPEPSMSDDPFPAPEISFLVKEPIIPAKKFNVLNFGAIGDGKTMETQALQSAIDSCAENNGGTVYFPAGVYLTGTLFLQSSIRLHLDKGAVLLGSDRLNDYPETIPDLRSYTDNYTVRSILYAENKENIAITGEGIINGQGARFPVERHPYKDRPYMIRMVACKNILIENIVYVNSPMWVQHYLACDHLTIRDITVSSRRSNLNNDGINIDGCHYVKISGCTIDSEDDGIVFKSTLNRSCRYTLVEYCKISSLCNGLKLGTESNSGFSDMVFRNCHVYNTRLSGIALEVVDGGTLENVHISDITMDQVNNPLFIRLGNRARPYKEGTPAPPVGILRNVAIKNVHAANSGYYWETHPFKNIPPITAHIPCSISGLREHPVEKIYLNNISIFYTAGHEDPYDASRVIPEREEAYPEHTMFGQLPASGFYLRHARDIHFNQVTVKTLKPDTRPVFYLDENTTRIFRDGE